MYIHHLLSCVYEKQTSPTYIPRPCNVFCATRLATPTPRIPLQPTPSFRAIGHVRPGMRLPFGPRKSMLLVQPTSFGSLKTAPDWWARTLFGTERAVRVGGHMWRVFSFSFGQVWAGPTGDGEGTCVGLVLLMGGNGRILAYGAKCMT